MEIERAVEILDPEHRERYESIEPVNTACRMGMEALARLVPRPPHPDGDEHILACPCCGSGEYLHNEDGNEQRFCGQCGQAIEWEKPAGKGREIRSFQGANFNGILGEALRFCTLDDTGRPCGRLVTGKVQKIRRQGKKTVVDIKISATGEVRTYPAAEIYFHGRPRKGLL